jgi:prepilin peptidase CpaA
MAQPTLFTLGFALLLTAVAALCDLRTGLIPNRLVLIGGAIGLGLAWLAAAARGGWTALPSAVGLSALGLVLCALVPLLLYRTGGIGGGDVKLLAVVGAVLGPQLGLEAELYAFALTIVYAPARLIWEGKLLSSMKLVGQLAVSPLLPKAKRKPAIEPTALTSFRFGPAIFIGTLLVAVVRTTGLS